MIADYSALLDAEAWAYIEKVNSFYPPEASTWSIGRNRSTYNEMCKVFHAGRPVSVQVTTTAFAVQDRAIAVRIYEPATASVDAVILYFHGGGFILGDLDSHDDICAEACERTGRAVVSLDYRLAPQHLHPAAFEDAVAAFDWTGRRFGRPVVLFGESAGGNLAAAVAHARRKVESPPLAQVLVYPVLGGDPNKGSYLVHCDAPLLSTADVVSYSCLRAGKVAIGRDPSFSPLDDDDFSGLPATTVFTAQCDPLASDGADYCEAILSAAGKACCHDEKGLMHGYLRARHMLGKAGRSFSRIIEALSAPLPMRCGQESALGTIVGIS